MPAWHLPRAAWGSYTFIAKPYASTHAHAHVKGVGTPAVVPANRPAPTWSASARRRALSALRPYKTPGCTRREGRGG